MFVITCLQCHRRHIVGYRSLVTMQNTDVGPVVVARCPGGHLTVTHFHDTMPAPAPAPAAISDPAADAARAVRDGIVAGVGTPTEASVNPCSQRPAASLG